MPDSLTALGDHGLAAPRLPAGRSSALSLALAGIAALLASTCCVLPLLFALAGISGAWIAQLRFMEPYANALTVLAAVSLSMAAWRIFGPARPVAGCDDFVACRPGSARARRWFWICAGLTLLPVLAQRFAFLLY